MKKFISVALLFVAMLVCGSVMAAQPKAKEFLGEWRVSDDTVSLILGEVPKEMGDASFGCVIDFVSKSKVEVYIDANLQFPIDEGVNMVMTFGCKLDCNWKYKKGVLNIEYYDINAWLEDLKLEPNDPEFQMAIEMFRPSVEAEMSRIIVDSFKGLPVVEAGDVTINGDKMIIFDGGNCLVLER